MSRPKPKNEDVLTVSEVSKILRVNPYTVYDLLKSNRLRGFRLFRRWRVFRKSVDNFIRATSQGESK